MRKIWLHLILIFLLGVLAYANSLNQQFIWDDDILVKENVYITSPAYLNHIFTSDVGEGGSTRYGFYRPIQILSYLVDYSLWKLHPLGYHITNILLHIGVALLVYWLVSLLFTDTLLAFLASVFFIIHPVHTEAVTYISGRPDPLAAFFMLAAFIIYLYQQRSSKSWRYFLFLAAYIMALLSRENSLIFPVLILVYHFAFRKKILKKEFFSVSLLACGYILLRFTLLKSILLPVTQRATLLERTPVFFAAIATYVKLLFLPLNLHMEYGVKNFSFLSPYALIGMLILARFIWVFWQKRENAKLSFAVGWFLAALIPFSNIYPINAYMAEHWLYLPSIGFVIFLAVVLAYLLRHKKFKLTGVLLTAGLFIFYTAFTIIQNNYWKDALTFYQRILQFNPQSAKVLNNLGNVCREKGDNQKAIEYYTRSIETDPAYFTAHNNLGIALSENKQESRAIKAYKKAIMLNPRFAYAYNNLGNLYKKMGDLEGASSLYEQALAINPHYPTAANNLANIYNDQGLASSAQGKNQEAIALYQKALQYNPQCRQAYNNLGVAYQKLRRYEEALSAYQKAVAIDPRYSEAYYNEGVVYTFLGKNNEAIAAYQKALELDPKNPSIHNNLAFSYYRQKEYRLAIYHCDEALRLGGQVHPQLLKLLEPHRKR